MNAKKRPPIKAAFSYITRQVDNYLPNLYLKLSIFER